MTETSFEPLRKTDTEGTLYFRLPEIEAQLGSLHDLSREELAERCAIQDRDNPNYVASECLVTLMRAYRSKQLDDCGEALFKALLERLLRGLPKAESFIGEKEDLTKGNIREEARFRFLEMLIRDRTGEYVEGLDFYEVRFAKAVRKLRLDAERKIHRRQDPLEALEIDHETGDFSPEVERATAIAGEFDPQNLQNLDYRTQLDAAIDDLPELQKAIVEMIRKGIPIESKEPGTVNISTMLQRTPKTIAVHRDKAYAKLRAKLTKGEPV